jgi:hypothetical protein
MTDPHTPEGAHPEEMRASYALRLGNKITLSGTARITPAGVITTGLAVSFILLSCAALLRATRSR